MRGWVRVWMRIRVTVWFIGWVRGGVRDGVRGLVKVGRRVWVRCLQTCFKQASSMHQAFCKYASIDLQFVAASEF